MTIAARRGIAVLLLSAPLAMAGCDLVPRTCTLIGCEDAVVLTFAEPIVADGSYDFAVTGDGIDARAHCTYTAATRSMVCDSDVRPLEVYLGPSGGIEGVTLFWTDVAPRWVRLQVARDNVIVGKAVVEALTYEILEPNGPECGPTCHQAGREIALESPAP